MSGYSSSENSIRQAPEFACGICRQRSKACDPRRWAHLRALGVTVEQRKAMEAGSMGGWDCPGADPANYENGEFVLRESEGMTMGTM